MLTMNYQDLPSMNMSEDRFLNEIRRWWLQYNGSIPTMSSSEIASGFAEDDYGGLLGSTPGDEDIPVITHSIRPDIVIFVYGLIVIVSLIGNILVCKIAFSGRTNGPNHRMRTTTDLLIGSLAVSDLIMTCINIPFNIARLLLPHWPFGSILCYCVPLVQTCCVYVSTFTMAAIALHRWRTVSAHHARARNLPTPYSNRTIIGLVWFLAALLATPTVAFNTLKQAIVNGERVFRCRVDFPFVGISLALTIIIFLTQYLMPLVLTAVLYVKIAKVVARQGRMVSKGPGGIGVSVSADDDKRRKRHLETKRRRIVMLSAVVAVFAICWLPINLYHLSVDLGIAQHRISVFLMCHWFAMSSVCYNSLIYCWLNANFRATAFETLSNVVHCFGCWTTPKSGVDGVSNGQARGQATAKATTVKQCGANNHQTGSNPTMTTTATTVLVDTSGCRGLDAARSRVEVPSSCQLLSNSSPDNVHLETADDDDDDGGSSNDEQVTTDIEMSRRFSSLPVPTVLTNSSSNNTNGGSHSQTGHAPLLSSSRKSSYKASGSSPFIDIIVQRPDATLSFESDLIDESCF